MSFIHTHADRRHFLRQSAALGAMAGSSLATNLALMGAAAAQSSNTDYRALVCVNLGGGNDNGNTVVPMGAADYAAYVAARQTIALPTASLQALSPTGYSGTPLGLHPSLVRLARLFNDGQAALLANVGTLAQPITKAEWDKRSPATKLPYQLFSHSDQSREWQAGIPDAVSRTGWLGRAGDLLHTLNTGSVSICMSLGGNNLLQVGQNKNVVQYQLTTQGPVQINKLDNPYGVTSTALRQLMTDSNRTHYMERELTSIARRAITTEVAVRTAITGSANMVAFGGGNLGAQLRMVARMIAARDALGHKKQIFYVSHGGYDFHSDLLANQATKLAEVDAAIADFHAQTVLLGIADKVTTFTSSEFGRELQTNGDGSDHGWGAHHFIVGGAVKGGRVYGSWPDVALKSNNDAGGGRLIPSTAVDQYAATLATWLGVDAGNLATVLPNIGRFGSNNLGFMA